MHHINKLKYHYWAMWGFVILSLFGVALRLMFIYPVPGLNYSFLLHAHSHFAFSGWAFLAIAILLVKEILPGRQRPEFSKIFIFTLISAFGMLISFSLQGYKAISISFSTLFILVNFYFSYRFLKIENLALNLNRVSLKFIKASLIFLCLSAAGPIALGPLMAVGLKTSALYNNAIYFYLHFQINGWMTLALLGLFANRYLSTDKLRKKSTLWVNIFIWSTIPLYFIFTLWDATSLWIRAIAVIGTLANFVSWYKLLIVMKGIEIRFPVLVKVALLAITVKVLLQLLICIPFIGSWVFSERNIIIGYIHLITLGCIAPFILEGFSNHNFLIKNVALSRINIVFIVVVSIYLTLLFLQPMLSLFIIMIPHFQVILFLVSVMFLLIGLVYLKKLKPGAVFLKVPKTQQNSLGL